MFRRLRKELVWVIAIVSIVALGFHLARPHHVDAGAATLEEAGVKHDAPGILPVAATPPPATPATPPPATPPPPPSSPAATQGDQNENPIRVVPPGAEARRARRPHAHDNLNPAVPTRSHHARNFPAQFHHFAESTNTRLSALTPVRCVDSVNAANQQDSMVHPALLPASMPLERLWPLPVQMFTGTGAATLPSTFMVVATSGQSEPARILQAAISRLCVGIFSPAAAQARGGGAAHLEVLTVEVRDMLLPLAADVDESYSLNITAGQPAVLRAHTVWGALQGLTTFSQLVGLGHTGHPEIQGLPLAIADAPALPWRGSLVDTARHFMPVPLIFKHLEAMALVKLNVFHWHITDYQSFPLELQSRPLLSAKGAHSQSEIYTRANVAAIVAFAMERGIRVLPEIDVPAHAGSWGLAYPEITGYCAKKIGALDPFNNVTLAVLSDVFAEVFEMFPDQYVHVGGDEVTVNCYNSMPSMNARFPNMNEFDPGSGVRYIVQETLDHVFALARRANKRVVVWDDVATLGVSLPKDFVTVQPWRCVPVDKCRLLATVLDGIDTIQSTCFYLDWDFPWTEAYTHELLNRECPAMRTALTSSPHMRGAEVCVWTERIDPSNFFCRAWPRSAAYAERWWLHATDLSPTLELALAGHARMAHVTALMQRIGIAAADIHAPSQGSESGGVCPLLASGV